jgi:hypothetical protein
LVSPLEAQLAGNVDDGHKCDRTETKQSHSHKDGNFFVSFDSTSIQGEECCSFKMHRDSLKVCDLTQLFSLIDKCNGHATKGADIFSMDEKSLQDAACYVRFDFQNNEGVDCGSFHRHRDSLKVCELNFIKDHSCFFPGSPQEGDTYMMGDGKESQKIKLHSQNNRKHGVHFDFSSIEDEGCCFLQRHVDSFKVTGLHPPHNGGFTTSEDVMSETTHPLSPCKEGTSTKEHGRQEEVCHVHFDCSNDEQECCTFQKHRDSMKVCVLRSAHDQNHVLHGCPKKKKGVPGKYSREPVTKVEDETSNSRNHVHFEYKHNEAEGCGDFHMHRDSLKLCGLTPMNSPAKLWVSCEQPGQPSIVIDLCKGSGVDEERCSQDGMCCIL